jgi:hypothetical protein
MTLKQMIKNIADLLKRVTELEAREEKMLAVLKNLVEPKP